MCMYVVLCCLFKLSSEGFARTMMTYVRFILQASTVAITRTYYQNSHRTNAKSRMAEV
jgi:hypothetical protein